MKTETAFSKKAHDSVQQIDNEMLLITKKIYIARTQGLFVAKASCRIEQMSFFEPNIDLFSGIGSASFLSKFMMKFKYMVSF